MFLNRDRLQTVTEYSQLGWRPELPVAKFGILERSRELAAWRGKTKGADVD